MYYLQYAFWVLAPGIPFLNLILVPLAPMRKQYKTTLIVCMVFLGFLMRDAIFGRGNLRPSVSPQSLQELVLYAVPALGIIFAYYLGIIRHFNENK
ncbi:MAG: hypothetical protein QOH93_1648 [Chloroflexia bacterium]|jgi:hypothetical protein|nr:hypothetical protein [Chloroflexia bacterium]